MSEKKDRVKIVMEVNYKDYDVVTTVTDDIIHDALGYVPMDKKLKGAVEGVAELDKNGTVPAAQLPSYVDDIINGYLYNENFYEDEAHTKKINPESGKIYVNISDNKTYRWSGSVYTVISETLALGETSSTAYRGDRGKIAYEHSQIFHAPVDAEKNQNAFSNIVVGDKSITAQTISDNINFSAGENINLNIDNENRRLVISADSYVLKVPTSTSLGGIKTGGDITISSDGIVTVNDDSHNHVIQNIDGLQTALNGKSDNHDHPYAGSLSSGGPANSAVKLTTDTAGAKNKPVYFSGGKPVACTYELNKSVPSDASFEPNTWRGIQNNLTSDSIVDSLSAKQGKVLKGLIDGMNYAGSSEVGGSATSAEKLNIDDAIGNPGSPIYFSNGVPQECVQKFAGSSSAGGSANSAVKLTTDTAGAKNKPVYFSGGKPVACDTTFASSSSAGGPANYAMQMAILDGGEPVPKETGSETRPVYFYNGVPTECDYELQANVYAEVPSNAIFTNFTKMTQAKSGTAGYVPAPTNNDFQTFLSSNGTWKTVDVINQHTLGTHVSNSKEYPLLVGSYNYYEPGYTYSDVSKTKDGDGNNLASFNPYNQVLTIGDGTTTGIVKASSFEGSLTGTAKYATYLKWSNGAMCNCGNRIKPVYFVDGEPVACDYVLGPMAEQDTEPIIKTNVTITNNTITISGLFTNYNLIYLFVTGTKGIHNHLVPLSYLTEKGTLHFYDTTDFWVQKKDDNTLYFFEYQNSGAETYSYCDVVFLY